MSLGNHSSLMQSENLWRYSSSCYSKTTRRLIVNGVVRHLLVFSSLIGDITIDRWSLAYDQVHISDIELVTPIQMVSYGRGNNNDKQVRSAASI